MRTTLRIRDDLLQAAKKLAAETGRTLTSVVEDALRESLARRDRPARKKRVRLTTFKGGAGVHPGVDLDSGASLLETMEGS